MSSPEMLVLYNHSPARLPQETFERLYQLFSPARQEKIGRFRQWQDAQRSIIGQALLLEGLQMLGLQALRLADIKYNEYDRPYFHTALDFNISHSGEYVMCAFTKTGRAGIDVEEIKDIPVSDFVEQFSAVELQDISAAAEPLRRFYSYWTKKESFLKALGTGLNVPLNKVSIQGDTIRWGNASWYLHEIPLDENHVSHLCTDLVVPEMDVKKIDFD